MRNDLGQRHRYAHSVRVARLAASLARAHRVDPRRAARAGILHDLARLMPADALVRECTSRGIPIGEFERRSPLVLHAPLGAALAAERYGIRDAAILDAIRSHTLAGPRLSPLAAIIYLADGLEPGRSFEEREEIVRVAYEDLHEGMRRLLESTVRYARARGLEAAPQTDAALAWYGAPGAAAHGREGAAMEDRLCKT